MLLSLDLLSWINIVATPLGTYQRFPCEIRSEGRWARITNEFRVFILFSVESGNSLIKIGNGLGRRDELSGNGDSIHVGCDLSERAVGPSRHLGLVS